MNTKRDRAEYRKYSLTVPLTKEEKDHIIALARKRGLATSAYVRMVMKNIED